MVPVELKLENFLSYGPETQILDFNRFHVACLSGKNGQGKSALLDAITWALWGEARKSSGSHKPDEELLRLGSRRMRVEFMFDIESERYRVIRSYSRSASGKTSKAELELQLIDSGQQDKGIPLTQPSIRETQRVLSERLGLEYDTFVNSSFILQGRSDEFTKKKPNERKNILGKILDLSKYDRLAESARNHQRSLEVEVEKLGREIEVIQQTLENEKEWREGFDALTKTVESKELVLSELRDGVARLLKATQEMDVFAQEIKSKKDTLAHLGEQIRQRGLELDELVEKIASAKDLLSQKDRIQEGYNKYSTLVAERDDLDIKRDLFRGIEKQLDSVKAEIVSKRGQIESKIYRLETDLQTFNRALNEIEHELNGRDEINGQLEKAREAKKLADQLGRQFEVEKTLQHTIAELEKKIFLKREQINGQLRGVRDHLEMQKAQARDIDKLQRKLEKIEQSVSDLDQLRKVIEETTKEGQSVSDEISRLEGIIKGIGDEVDIVDQHASELKREGGSKCPTCGTVLTDEHRQQAMLRLEEDKNKALLKKTEQLKEIEELSKSAHCLGRSLKRSQEEQNL